MTKITMTASRSTGPVLHRNGLSHRYAQEGGATAIFATDLDTPERFHQPIAACHLTLISAISNRYNKLLEFPVTDTKQTTAPHSNRYKTPLFPIPFAEPECGPFAFIGPELFRARAKELLENDQRYRAEAVRSTPLAVLNIAAARTRETLIANEMHSAQVATNSKRATYDFLVANEFQFAKIGLA
ncbi:MAG TPA: hypothetical protein VGR84_03995 [Candidatus Acidoferrales bacterium]|nr:hypothetical protein [Candidatus Acidoferrales bacterium]